VGCISDISISLSILKRINDIREIDEEFRTNLEISSLSNYYQKKKRTALLFNNPSGNNNVLLIGLFGTYSRLQNMMERNVPHIFKNFASLF